VLIAQQQWTWLNFWAGWMHTEEMQGRYGIETDYTGGWVDGTVARARGLRE
jgi:hypothetical protein